MLLRIYWIEQIAFLHTLQATISALKNDVNLLRAILHCVRAFTFEKTISTSTTKYKCRCELGKTRQDLATALREISPTQIPIILLISNILRCFDRDFRRPYRYFSFILKRDFTLVWSLWKFSPLTDFGLNSRDKLFNKKVLNDSN